MSHFSMDQQPSSTPVYDDDGQLCRYTPDPRRRSAVYSRESNSMLSSGSKSRSDPSIVEPFEQTRRSSVDTVRSSTLTSYFATSPSRSKLLNVFRGVGKRDVPPRVPTSPISTNTLPGGLIHQNTPLSLSMQEITITPASEQISPSRDSENRARRRDFHRSVVGTTKVRGDALLHCDDKYITYGDYMLAKAAFELSAERTESSIMGTVVDPCAPKPLANCTLEDGKSKKIPVKAPEGFFEGSVFVSARTREQNKLQGDSSNRHSERPPLQPPTQKVTSKEIQLKPQPEPAGLQAQGELGADSELSMRRAPILEFLGSRLLRFKRRDDTAGENSKQASTTEGTFSNSNLDTGCPSVSNIFKRKRRTAPDVTSIPDLSDVKDPRSQMRPRLQSRATLQYQSYCKVENVLGLRRHRFLRLLGTSLECYSQDLRHLLWKVDVQNALVTENKNASKIKILLPDNGRTIMFHVDSPTMVPGWMQALNRASAKIPLKYSSQKTAKELERERQAYRTMAKRIYVA